MSRTEYVINLLRAGAFWFMASMFLWGMTLMTLHMFVPGFLQDWKIIGFLNSSISFLTTVPPYTWLHLSPAQMTMIGILVDALGLTALMSRPKVAGTVIFGVTFWRQLFMRMHAMDKKMPMSPLCGYKQANCLFMDLFNLVMVACGVLIFTSPYPLIESTLVALKLAGIRTHWIEKTLRRGHMIGGPPSVPQASPVAAAGGPQKKTL
jgi:hypothetical protein